MKKQKKTYDIGGIITVILLILIGIAVVLILVSYMVDNFKPDYKIYKTECYNKTLSSLQEIKCFGDDGWELIGNRYTGKYSMNSSIALWALKNNITNFKVQIQTGDYECVMGDLECVHKSNATINMCAYGDIIINNKVCEDKEVEEMSSEFPLDKDNTINNLVVIGKLRCLHNNLYIDALNEAYKAFNYTSFKKDCNEYNFKINNKDLIKEWLEENCACIDKPYGVSSCTKKIPDYCYINDYNSAQYSIPGIKILNSSKQECLDCGQTYIFPEDCSEYKCGENYKVVKQ